MLVNRKTSIGQFSISPDLVVTLDGAVVPGYFDTFTRPVNGRVAFYLTRRGRGDDVQFGLDKAEWALISAAKARLASPVVVTPEAKLLAERNALVGALQSTDAFPGSREWKRANEAEKALAAFDAAHPEVFASQSTPTPAPTGHEELSR
jgi:hypothetical protein